MSSLIARSLPLFTLFLIALTGGAQAQSFSVIHNFSGGNDGAGPAAGLTIDRAGSFYGTAASGGIGYGTVFKLVHQNVSWLITQLYSFTDEDDGALPQARAIMGPDGTLFGSTLSGGGGDCFAPPATGCGTVYHLTPPPRTSSSTRASWTDKVLHAFTYPSSDGIFPGFGDLIFDQFGNLYGTTTAGGAFGKGIVYKLKYSNGSWSESIVYNFRGIDGADPVSGLIFDSAGNLFGTTEGGGAYNLGTVYELTPSGSGWGEQVLYSFQNQADGSTPFGGLIFDRSGNLYGTTADGGPNEGGTVFELIRSVDGTWTHSLLYGFRGSYGDNDGPFASLAIDSAGNLYGTTFMAGAYGRGSVFELSPSGGGWIYTDLHDFTGGRDGGSSSGGVLLGDDGNLYGTAGSGGAYNNCPSGCGVIWEITP